MIYGKKTLRGWFLACARACIARGKFSRAAHYATLASPWSAL